MIEEVSAVLIALPDSQEHLHSGGFVTTQSVAAGLAEQQEGPPLSQLSAPPRKPAIPS